MVNPITDSKGTQDLHSGGKLKSDNAQAVPSSAYMSSSPKENPALQVGEDVIASSSSEKAEVKLKLMVIEDEELLLQAISQKLVNLGFDVVTCTSARQALDYLKNFLKLPDAIWLDYYLPDMNGLEFVRELKKNEKWGRIPVIVVSNSASDQKKNAMLALGVEKYVLKAQFRLEEIVDMIRKMIASS